MKIAVIGSGISGLSAAWLLQTRYDVTVYEQNQYIGGHTHTVDVPRSGDSMAVDTGFIVYNERNYPHLTALFDHLGVETRGSDMSFGVSLDNGRVEYAGDNLNTLFGQRKNFFRPSHWRMIREILRFNRQAKSLLGDPVLEDQTLGAFLDDNGYSQALRDRYLIPMAAAIWSCPPRTMLGFPAASFLRFFDNHGLLDLSGRPVWRTVVGGSREYVRRLTATFANRIQVGCPAVRVVRDAGGVTVIDGEGRKVRYDQVVFGCHADQALQLIDRPSVWETKLLTAFRYQPNRVYLHTDERLMPRRRNVWASWNYVSNRSDGGERDVSVSYWMNRLQGLSGDTQYIVSLNPVRKPRASHVIGVYDYDHPVFSLSAMRAQPLLDRLQGQNHSWFCGAYFGYGFHEDGLRSGVHLAARLGVPAPWMEGATPLKQSAVIAGVDSIDVDGVANIG
ncbi:MAG: FAD-dependent oxidoreductase [Pseudomonadota bacterium]|nr:FAD-dependent oxidoreductase [Pseudomonadota bacterium]